MIQLIRGFKDILPGEIELWQKIEAVVAALFQDFGFHEIRIPIMEKTALFARTIGENTDIVEKEMYTFPDRKGDLITLRPEATASVVRAYIQHKLYAKEAIQKFYTIGPMFRRERPQKGRYRQFYQINAEVFGVAAPQIDAQLIIMLSTLLDRLEVKNTTAHINSLGCFECRPGFKAALKEFLGECRDQLCSDCLRRMEKNPLRVLDCKVPDCKKAMEKAPALLDYLCSPCQEHFEQVQKLLNIFKISYIIDQHLVRGLDYYNRTTFEIQTSALGAQSAVAGGGRYDGLVKTLGGSDQPAIGFAIGFDRLVEIIRQNSEIQKAVPDLFIAALGETAKTKAFDWLINFNLAGLKTEMEFSQKSLKTQMKRANRIGAKQVLIIGENELVQESVILRDMSTKEQIMIPISNLVEQVLAQFGLKGEN